MRNWGEKSRYAMCFPLLVMVLSACTSDQLQRQQQPQIPPAAVGSDRDAHGCIGSAGYTWCAREKACVRPWELASQKGGKSNAHAFERYCSEAPK